jgi:hypothetical protein
MKIYNATNSKITLPLGGNYISISPHDASENFMVNEDALSLWITSYDDTEIALIVGGASEVSLCSRVSGSVAYVVYTLEDAVKKFAQKDKSETPTPKVEVISEKEAEPVSESAPVSEEPVSEETAKSDEPAPVEVSQGEAKKEEEAPKKTLTIKRKKKSTKE